MTQNKIDELKKWLKQQIEFEIKTGNETKEMGEKVFGGKLGYWMSTIHYQKAVAYERCLWKFEEIKDDTEQN